MTRKILPAAALARTLSGLRRRKKKVVFTNGCFDLIHTGHLTVLEWAKRQGDVLVVALNSDASVRRLKGPKRPILKEKDRTRLIAGFSVVDFVTVFSEDTPDRLIRLIKPDVLVKGGDWKADQIVGRDVVKKLVRVPLVKGQSTSGIIKTIVDRYGRS
jgi:D-beta-D-heptose 7-phosphate kinase/D-beta-D-heptose 1-phosphate adenosyltransferase